MNIYAIDYSSQMLCAFENDAHVGGVIIEGEDQRIRRFFGLLTDILNKRKQQIRGGSFRQYIKSHGQVMPAIVVVIDGYANFREKTEKDYNEYEARLMELSRTAEGYGIYLVISCTSFGAADMPSRIADNMRQAVCLELADKYRYADVLKNTHFDVLPEKNVHGRGLASIDGKILEYQTALCCAKTADIADGRSQVLDETDYGRQIIIREQCLKMSASWTGSTAVPIPEIPKEPSWNLFSKQEPYREALASKHLLPVAYFQKDASIYSIDLTRIYRYMVIGTERSGKTNTMRNIVCAARDHGGELVVIDNAQKREERTAKLGNARYVCDRKELFGFTKDLLDEMNARAKYRREIMSQELREEEIYGMMSEKYPALFIFFMDFSDFIKQIYMSTPDVPATNPQYEPLFERGKNLNIYLFAAVNISQLMGMMDKPAYNSFMSEKSGIVLGGPLKSQGILNYSSVRPYEEQSKKIRMGFGYAANMEDNQILDLIVIPQNRLTQERTGEDAEGVPVSTPFRMHSEDQV